MRRRRHNPLARLNFDSYAVIASKKPHEETDEWFILMVRYRDALRYSKALFKDCPPPTLSSRTRIEQMAGLSGGLVGEIVGYTGGMVHGNQLVVAGSGAEYGVGAYVSEMKYYMARKWGFNGVMSDRGGVSVHALRHYSRIYWDDNFIKIPLTPGTLLWPEYREELNWAYMPKNFHVLIPPNDKARMVNRGNQILKTIRKSAGGVSGWDGSDLAIEIVQGAADTYFSILYDRLSPSERDIE